MVRNGAYFLLCSLLCSLMLAGCKSKSHPASDANVQPSASSAVVGSARPDGVDLEQTAADVPIIGAKGLFIMVRDRPHMKGAKSIGYLRLGAVVQRSAEPVSGSGCKGGWYEIKPRGYVCLDNDGTLDRDHPVLRAASRRPDLTKPMPYAYGFVRAVLPFYLRVPTAEEQFASEFQLKEHLQWWEKEGKALTEKRVLGANDVFIDLMGVPIDEQKVVRSTLEMTEGELYGAKGPDETTPWWLDGGRKIPNVAKFQVPEYAVFADRARRFTGLTFVGSFPTGAESLNRRFAITEDLRLAPTSKVRPDGGTTFHGTVIGDKVTIPFAWIKAQDAKRYRIDGDKVRAYKQRAQYRQIVKLTGKKQFLDKRLYYEMDDGKWVRSRDIAIAANPSEMPVEAKAGEKWIDVSIRQQVMLLWEGTKPVYGALVSTGQDMLGDPKTTKSTVLGKFRMESKHVTTDMDSAEGLTRSSGDPEYGKSKRRGQGTFLLQNVPWVQYFKGSYAFHATYWHDVFGTARSHGCINMTPIDAHRVFFWTHPTVPKGWHGAYPASANDGTLVYIHE